MVHKLDLEQNNVLAFRIEGKLDHDTFTNMVKEMDEEFAHHDHFRLYLEIPELEGLEFRVIWDSIQFAVTHFRKYINQIDRIAVVTNEKWLQRATELENMFIAGITEKAFTFGEMDMARDWVKEFVPDLTM